MSLTLMDSYNPTVQALQRKNKKLRAENERLSNNCLNKDVEIADLKAELAEAKKDAELWREREARIRSLRERGFLGSPLRNEPYKVDMKGK